MFYGALFLIYGVHLPYLPVWLDWRGLSATEIAIITSTPFFLRLIVTPAVAVFADNRNTHRLAVIAFSGLATLASLSLTLSYGFWPLLLAACALSLAMTTIMPLTETIAVSGVKSFAADYGRMRLWGSLTFIIANMGGGYIIAAQGAGAALPLIIAACAACTAASLFLPHRALSPTTADEQPTVPTALPSAGQPSAQSPALSASSVSKLLSRRDFLALLIATGCVQAAHATYYTFGTLHWLSLGISPDTAGLLWAIGVIAEIALFAVSAPVLRQLGPTGLLVLACLAAVIRWALMTQDPPLAGLVGLQLLHGFTYGAAHLAAIHFMARTIPDNLAGTAQAVYATVGTGAAMGAATLLAGIVKQEAGTQAAYAAMSILALAGLAAALALHSAPQRLRRR